MNLDRWQGQPRYRTRILAALLVPFLAIEVWVALVRLFAWLTVGE